MAELKLTALQERFFLAILEGKPPGAALQAARAAVPIAKGQKELTPASARKAASELLRKPAIASALARAREAIQSKVELKVEDLVDQLMEARTVALAYDPPQVSAAVAATMGTAKLLGLVIDRSQVDIVHSKPSLLPVTQLELSVEEWKRQFDPPQKKIA